MNNFNLVELEDQHLLNKTDLSSYRRHINPSSCSVEYIQDGFKFIEGTCLRESYYRITRVPRTEPDTAYLKRVAEIGKWTEQGIIERWKNMGLFVQNNVKFFNESKYISGELDCVLRDNISGKLRPYEIKTFYGDQAEKLIKGFKRPPIPGAPKRHQYLQSSIYNWEFKQTYGDEIENYRMYYCERGNATAYEFEIGYDLRPDGKHICWFEQVPSNYWNFYSPGKQYMSFTIEDIYGRIDKLIDYIKRKELPPKDYGTPWDANRIEYLHSKKEIAESKYKEWKANPKQVVLTDWGCRYCSYKSKCAKDEMEKCI